jgi:LysM repeat protein
VANYKRYLGPAGLLLAVTLAVVLIKVVGHHSSTPPSTTTTTRTATVVARRFWTVRAGDTLAVIARKNGVTIAEIEHLNPHVSSTSLHIGQKLRLR